MNKKLLVSLGLAAFLSVTAISTAVADSTIYTDGIGRMHFLGRDAASSTGIHNNYSNSAEQDLTRKLYQDGYGVNNDESFDQHPLKNYENTFSDSRFTTTSVWKQKYETKGLDELQNVGKGKTVVTAEKGTMDTFNPYVTNTDNTVKTTTKKKHWWNK